MATEAQAPIEFQRLHGMGEALYRAARGRWGEFLVRAYAPVGGHEDLLPYLVRRLLENGANTSFVHALLDERVPAEAVVRDPIAIVESAPRPHPRIPTPPHIYGASRRNSLGRDFSQAAERTRLARAVRSVDDELVEAGPIVGGAVFRDGGQPVASPADGARVVGEVTEARETDVDEALRLARAAQPGWDRQGGPARAKVLRAMADALERDIATVWWRFWRARPARRWPTASPKCARRPTSAATTRSWPRPSSPAPRP